MVQAWFSGSTTGSGLLHGMTFGYMVFTASRQVPATLVQSLFQRVKAGYAALDPETVNLLN